MAQPRHAPLLILLASLAVLSAAFAFQYIGGLDPCILCIYQRFPYGVTIGLGAIALVLAHRGRSAALAAFSLWAARGLARRGAAQGSAS